MVAWLQSHEHRRAIGSEFYFFKSLNLGVITAVPFVEAFRDDSALFHDHATDHRIR
jgi:hypothetical protein